MVLYVVQLYVVDVPGMKACTIRYLTLRRAANKLFFSRMSYYCHDRRAGTTVPLAAVRFLARTVHLFSYGISRTEFSFGNRYLKYLEVVEVLTKLRLL
jgi:hypothetical protein